MVMQQVREEDAIDKDEGILYPVKNFLIVDKLREEKKLLKDLLIQKDQAFAEKDHEIIALREEIKRLK